jgi:hypothetical protein
MAVKITHKGNLRTFLRRVQKANLSKTMAKEFAKELKQSVVENTQMRTGELESSIREKKTCNQNYGVYANDYFWVVNNGRMPGSIPPTGGKLGMWARSSNQFSDPFGDRRLALTIAKYGTKPKHYYEKAKMRFEPKKSRIVTKKIRRG